MWETKNAKLLLDLAKPKKAKQKPFSQKHSAKRIRLFSKQHSRNSQWQILEMKTTMIGKMLKVISLTLNSKNCLIIFESMMVLSMRGTKLTDLN